jgi:hypothetical protein
MRKSAAISERNATSVATTAGPILKIGSGSLEP